MTCSKSLPSSAWLTVGGLHSSPKAFICVHRLLLSNRLLNTVEIQTCFSWLSKPREFTTKSIRSFSLGETFGKMAEFAGRTSSASGCAGGSEPSSTATRGNSLMPETSAKMMLLKISLRSLKATEGGSLLNTVQATSRGVQPLIGIGGSLRGGSPISLSVLSALLTVSLSSELSTLSGADGSGGGFVPCCAVSGSSVTAIVGRVKPMSCNTFSQRATR
mmetsp:Transcript_25345/g.30042  ORF Transcript_25345/g.30042 Transcript_25345/m.30042 type:complete len:218 (+) Transcript_25345:708-1361(+)